LIQYGVPRVPGEFGAAALTALGPMLAVHFIKIARVTPLLLGLNMLMVIGYAAGPLGVVLLSKVSMMLGQNQHDAVQARLRLLVAGVMELSVFTCIQLAIFADVVVRAWVGPGFLDEMGVIRVVLLAIPFYLFFAALRSTIDAATVKPYNTANVMTSLAVYVALIFAWIKLLPGQSLLGGIAGALLVSQILLALLTARTFRRAYGVGVPWRKLGPSFAAALVLGGVALLFRWWQHGSVPVPEAVLAEAALAAIYLAVLARLGSGWLSYAWNVGICRRAEWTVPAAETGGAK
jgi:O-antigen/teichoic acid export membrane protein